MYDEVDISNKILELTRITAPETTQKLLEIIDQELGIPKDIALKYIIELENQGKLRLSQPPEMIPKNLDDYLLTTHGLWFWINIVLSVVTAISVFTISDKNIPYIYIRYILGFIFVFILPGFSLIKFLFPTREMDNIERTAISIGTSLVLVPLVGFLLNFTPWGIRLTSITFSLLALTILLTFLGLMREYKEKLKAYT
jgi:hypothetical protein